MAFGKKWRENQPFSTWANNFDKEAKHTMDKESFFIKWCWESWKGHEKE